MKRLFTYDIKTDEQNKTVEEFLRTRGFSHRLVVHLRDTPMGLSLNGEPVFTNHKLAVGDTLKALLIEDTSSRNIVPSDLPLHIVYEDEDILVINKDAGVPVHPSQGHFENTLANAVAWYYSQKKEPFVFRAISRLDRDTTGLLLLAKHMLSACVLSQQMAERQIHREYRAIVCGCTEESGTVSAPIGRADGSTIERQVDFSHGESACTHYRRLSYNPDLDLSCLSLKLDTGRTHQIRVHMSYIGHPLPGDFLYCPDYRYINRQPLHSFRLSFTHPVTGEPMEFTAPLPEDMGRLL